MAQERFSGIFDVRDYGAVGDAATVVDGGTMDGINVSNIVMSNVKGAAIFIRLGNRGRPYRQENPPVGALRNVQISNLPFDQFVVEQLAGDLLANPTVDQLVATGFNRCHVSTNEGGSIEEEVYVRNVVDRVSTTGTVFMGLTLECTRCHDHKYDPFTMEDFYSLFAYFNSIDGKALDGNRKDHPPVVREIPTTLVFKEAEAPREAFVLNRGEYDQRGKEVSRRTPSILPALGSGLPNDRLGFARWLVDPDHPLTARVTVNRFWQQFFGTSIVKTAEDFGSQGEPPSHQELLDWLAVEFVESGWNVQALVKQIVMSATYRQTSRVSRDQYALDPENRFLARGARFRLDAEVLRDQALFVSGLLVEQLGGPSVKPPQPDGLWYAVGYSGSNTVRFIEDKGPGKVHRRTLYTFIKRTAPPPQMSTIDAPSREACSVRRERTNTPLQALLLMNEPQYFEAARALALHAMHDGGDTPETRAAYIFRRCTCRHADEAEIKELLVNYHGHLKEFDSDADAANTVARFQDNDSGDATNALQLAAWTMVANLVLNLDEVINKN
jgi:hypothetical protein